MFLQCLPWIVLLVCGGYLLARLLGVVLRVRWARRAYPTVITAASPIADRQSIDWRNRCRGLLLGGAIGDALGLPAESLPRWLVALRYRSEPAMRRGVVRLTRRAGDISDDTQLTLAVARSIDPLGTYVHERFLDELAVWYGFRVGPGRACSIAARRLRRAPLSGGTGLPSEGNGAAIRVGPLAIASDDEALLIANVRRNASVTHTAEPAIAAAAFLALLLARILRSQPKRPELAALVEQTATRSRFSLLPALEASRSSATIADKLRRVGTSGHVAQSVNAAVVLLLEGLDFEPAVRAAFRAGGDVDSVGAMIGTLIGARVGLDHLPGRWVSQVQHREVLLQTADALSAPRPASSSDTRAAEIVEVAADVARRPVDAIVNAWNRNVIPWWLLLPQGVSRSIRRAGGAAAIRDVSGRAPLPLGSATETVAGQLDARWIIHVAGINLRWRGSEGTTRTAARNALSMARCLGARSVAVPLIGSGSGGLSTGRARAIIVEELQRAAAFFDRLEIVTPQIRSPDSEQRS